LEVVQVINWVCQLWIRAAAVANIYHHQLAIRQFDDGAIAIADIEKVQCHAHGILLSLVVLMLFAFSRRARTRLTTASRSPAVSPSTSDTTSSKA
jgi:hypothetical protein